MSTPQNPYAAPKAPVADQTLATPGNYDPNGRARPAGNGWSWIAEGWRLFMRSPGMWIALIVVLGVIMIVLNFIPFIGPIALAVLMPVFGGGLMLGCRALDEGRGLEFNTLFAGFQKPQLAGLATVGAIYLGLAFAIGLVVALITGASMFAMMSGGAQNPAVTTGALGGMMLGILIGLALAVPLAMLMWFAPAAVALNGVAPVEALKASWRGCLKNIVPFLLYGVVLLVLAFVASLPFMLGWLVLGPVMAASIYASYRDIYLS